MTPTVTIGGGGEGSDAVIRIVSTPEGQSPDCEEDARALLDVLDDKIPAKTLGHLLSLALEEAAQMADSGLRNMEYHHPEKVPDMLATGKLMRPEMIRAVARHLRGE
jgi:hypothetical protein